MAVDTASKRYTINHVTIPWRMVGTVPDGTTSAGNRQADGYIYSGIDASITTADFICIKDSSIAAPYATGTLNQSYATATIKCKGET